MIFNDMRERALEIREKYRMLEIKKYGKNWTPEQIAEGFIGDVGDLMKLIQAKSGIRDIENTDAKLAHELADCLWCIIVLSKEYGIDIEKEFLQTMDTLEKRIQIQSKS